MKAENFLDESIKMIHTSPNILCLRMSPFVISCSCQRDNEGYVWVLVTILVTYKKEVLALWK